MKIKQTLIIFAVLIGFFGSLFALAPTVSAEDCGDYNTSVLPCKTDGEEGIWGILQLVLNILTAGVGIVAIGGILYGSILYTSAGGNPEQVKNARTILKNVVIGLVAYVLMFSLLNYLIPGGLLS